MRTFIALDLPYADRKRIARFSQSLQDDLPKKNVSWTKIDQFHLTLKFLGNISDNQQQAISGGLRSLSFPEGFRFTLKGLHVFPHWKAPRVIWIELSYYKPLLTLKKTLDAFLESLNFPPDKRTFHPHITIGRIKKRLSTSEISLLKEYSDVVIATDVQFEYLTFYQSVLHTKGAQHIPLVRRQFPQI